MAHLLQHKCYIHCVFLLKKTEISNSCCSRVLVFFVFLCIDHTLLFETRANFVSRHWKAQNKMAIALLEIWSLLKYHTVSYNSSMFLRCFV